MSQRALHRCLPRVALAFAGVILGVFCKFASPSAGFSRGSWEKRLNADESSERSLRMFRVSINLVISSGGN